MSVKENPSGKKASAEHSVWLFSLSIAPLFGLSAIVSLAQLASTLCGARSCDSGVDGNQVYQFATLVLSALMLLIALVTTIRASKATRRKCGPGMYEIDRVEADGQQALTFFFSIEVPVISIAISDSLAAFACFWSIVLIMAFLLVRTETCFWNPVLVMFGYKLYEVSFVEDDLLCRLVSRERLAKGDRVCLVRISGNYFYAGKQ